MKRTVFNGFSFSLIFKILLMGLENVDTLSTPDKCQKLMKFANVFQVLEPVNTSTLINFQDYIPLINSHNAIIGQISHKRESSKSNHGQRKNVI